MIGGGKLGALGCASAACSQAAHSGLWTNPGKGLGSFDASTSALMGLGGRCGCTRRVVRPHDVHEEADQHESDQQELVKQRGGYHWEPPSHQSEIGVFYLIDSCWNYPLSRGTRPGWNTPGRWRNGWSPSTSTAMSAMMKRNGSFQELNTSMAPLKER
jgi:hypothetical protein